MENKRRLYIDETREEPGTAPTASQEAVGGGFGEEVGSSSGLGSAGLEKAATSSQEAVEGRSEEKADKHGGLEKKAPEADAAVTGAAGAASVAAAKPTTTEAAGKPAVAGVNRKAPKIGAAGKMPKKVSKRTWILIGVLAVVAIGAIVTAVLLLGGGDSGNQGNKAPDTSISGNGGDADGSDKQEPDESGEDSGEETITLSTGDARVQKLYGYFEPVNFASPLMKLADFYQNRGSFAGELGDLVMLDLALANLEPVECAMQPTDDDLMRRYEGWFGSEEELPTIEGFRRMYDSGCYSGQAVRDKVKEIFGKDLQLSQALLAGEETSFYGYDTKNDEIFSLVEGRGGTYPRFERELIRAERDSERMYLYETVSVEVPGVGGSISLYDKCLTPAETEEDYEANNANGCYDEDYKWQTGTTRFRLVFRRTDAGNYVFEKIERAERE